MKAKETVLIYIEKDNSYLMLFRNKKEKDFNTNKYIGIGGHIENNETKENALIREVKEETNLTLLNYQYRAKLRFINDDYDEIMHLYTSTDFIGELSECDEGTLCWVPIDKINDLPLWEGDRYFLPLLTKNTPFFEMDLIYSEDKLINHVIRFVD